jgi:hypothetical protein
LIENDCELIKSPLTQLPLIIFSIYLKPNLKIEKRKKRVKRIFDKLQTYKSFLIYY